MFAKKNGRVHSHTLQNHFFMDPEWTIPVIQKLIKKVVFGNNSGIIFSHFSIKKHNHYKCLNKGFLINSITLFSWKNKKNSNRFWLRKVEEKSNSFIYKIL